MATTMSNFDMKADFRASTTDGADRSHIPEHPMWAVFLRGAQLVSLPSDSSPLSARRSADGVGCRGLGDGPHSIGGPWLWREFWEYLHCCD